MILVGDGALLNRVLEIMTGHSAMERLMDI